ncbi:hypothetical protein ACN6K9_006264 [Streptomyces sp. SAS_267]
MGNASVDEQPVTAMIARSPGFIGDESTVDPLADPRQRMRPQSVTHISAIPLRHRQDINTEADRIRVGSLSIIKVLRSYPFNPDDISGITVPSEKPQIIDVRHFTAESFFDVRDSERPGAIAGKSAIS